MHYSCAAVRLIYARVYDTCMTPAPCTCSIALTEGPISIPTSVSVTVICDPLTQNYLPIIARHEVNSSTSF